MVDQDHKNAESMQIFLELYQLKTTLILLQKHLMLLRMFIGIDAVCLVLLDAFVFHLLAGEESVYIFATMLVYTTGKTFLLAAVASFIIQVGLTSCTNNISLYFLKLTAAFHLMWKSYSFVFFFNQNTTTLKS